jgi:hypothetical protein
VSRIRARSHEVVETGIELRGERLEFGRMARDECRGWDALFLGRARVF